MPDIDAAVMVKCQLAAYIAWGERELTDTLPDHPMVQEKYRRVAQAVLLAADYPALCERIATLEGLLREAEHVFELQDAIGSLPVVAKKLGSVRRAKYEVWIQAVWAFIEKLDDWKANSCWTAWEVPKGGDGDE